MVGTGPTAAAAVEERQRKLQEYLAAKGKLKSQNTKPYLKSKNNCQNPPPSKSTIRPKNDVTNHVVLPVKPKRSISIKLQPRPPNTTGSQKPKLEPPKLLGKRLTSESVSSNPYSKPSSKSFQQREAGSSITGELSRKPVGSLNIEQLKTTKQQLTDQENAKSKSTDFGLQVEKGCSPEPFSE
uniref:Cytoskeleton associated protein 2 like n=1 Tax=Nomascus leucogenys TaxID=61853 RepID=A0A2I3H896_NOMLE